MLAYIWFIASQFLHVGLYICLAMSTLFDITIYALARSYIKVLVRVCMSLLILKSTKFGYRLKVYD